MYYLKIKDVDDLNVLNVTLLELLEIINPFTNGLQWAIYDLYSTGDLGEGTSLPDFESEISNRKNGFLISWNDLISLASKLYQVIDLVLVGNNNNFKEYQNSNEWRKDYKIVIEFFDSTYCEIYSSDKELIDYIAKKYKNTEIKII